MARSRITSYNVCYTKLLREARRQYTEWQQARGTEQTAVEETAAETQTEQPAQGTSSTESTPADTQEARLQLVAPDDEAIKGAAVP